jgi:hypothetical protein
MVGPVVVGEGSMRRWSFALIVLAVSCSSPPAPLGGGPTGESFDPCGPNPVAGFDPDQRGLTKCCTDGPAHCVPSSAVPDQLASYLTPCDDPSQLCMPDSVIHAGASYQPAQCTSLGNEKGVCLSLCIPKVGNDPQVGLLPQDICGDGEVCVPCINPLNKMSTGACSLLGPHCGDGGLTGGSDDGGGGTCPYVGPPIVDPSKFAACAPACGGAHCVPATLVPAAQQSLLSACTASDGSGGFCAPDKVVAAGGNYVPPTCRSVVGAEGRCMSTCLPAVAAQASVLPKDTCGDGEVCAPCFNPVASDPTAPTGACTLACDAPKEPPLVITCPWTGPPLTDPTKFPDCAPTCAGSHCVPSALVPSAQQALLAACPGGFCAPDSFVAAGGKVKPGTCTSIAGAEGRCLSTCLAPVGAQAAQLPTDVCPAGEKCAPCFNPTAADPTAPTGACSIGCDQAKEPPTVLTCPWTGPDVVDPSTFPPCDDSCAGAHCLPASLVPAAQQSMLAACSGGFCVPDPQIRTAGHGVPPHCSPFPGAPAEGRCLSQCIPMVAQKSSQLIQDTCAADEKCVPCFDPFSGAATGACTTACDAPTRSPWLFPACCANGGTCVPQAQVPSSQASNLQQESCPSQFLCVPDEYLPTPTLPISGCSTLLFGGGTCVSLCVSLPAGAGIFGQRQCPDNHTCVPCSLAPAGTPGC